MAVLLRPGMLRKIAAVWLQKWYGDHETTRTTNANAAIRGQYHLALGKPLVESTKKACLSKHALVHGRQLLAQDEELSCKPGFRPRFGRLKGLLLLTTIWLHQIRRSYLVMPLGLRLPSSEARGLSNYLSQGF